MAEETPNILDQLNKAFLSKKHEDFSRYTQDIQQFGHVPANQYDHAWGLIKSQKRDINKEKFNFLNDPMIYLGNVDNEKTLAFYQNDFRILTNLLAMALTDESMRFVFEPLAEFHKIEIRLTANIGGGERQFQAFHVPVMQAEKKGFKILGRRKKKKQPIEYVIPPEEEIQESMY